MRSFGIVPDEPVEQLEVESVDVDHLTFVKIDVFLLDCAIETFAMSIHFRGLRIGVPMPETEVSEFLVEVFHELGSIVCQNILETVWKQDTDHLEKICCGL